MAKVTTDLEYDLPIVLDIFQHNKHSSLKFAEIMQRAVKANPRITTPRVNDALVHLINTEVISKVAYGVFRWKPVRPSSEVVLSAPATTQEVEKIVPRFKEAMKDTIYSALYEVFPNGAKISQVCDYLEFRDRSKKVSCSATMSALVKEGWVKTIGTQKYNKVFMALLVNQFGKFPEVSDEKPATTVQPTATKKQTSFSMDEVKRYHSLQLERAGLEKQKTALQARLDEVNTQLKPFEE